MNMQIACAEHAMTAGLAIGALVVTLAIGALIVRCRRRVPCTRAVLPEDRAAIERAFAEMDELDGREAPEGEYRAAIDALTRPLPSWGAAMAIERLTDRESPSRRRYLAMLECAEIREERERLVEIARDVTDPLAAEVWALLTGRPAGDWAKALVASDGGDNEKEFLRRV
jgi:hypothetical protein